MQRPRNRQPRPPRQQNQRGRWDGRGGHNSSRSRPTHSLVPSTQQVVPGAAVSIVLKQDQPTGHEVQGIVQELLTHGDHPRGIKVRLRDGRVGRVQRMVNTDSVSGHSSSAPVRALSTGRSPGNLTEQIPAPRTLADYLEDFESEPDAQPQRSEYALKTVTTKCPICGIFEGDEIAVSRHVDGHFS